MTRSESTPDRPVVEFVERSGLVPRGVVPRFEPLNGGVSSDIWIVRAGQATFCLKRALPRLRVAADWRAPIARNANEVAWMKAVAGFMPGTTPEVLASDADLGVFAMEYLSPDAFEQWKMQLRRGVVSQDTADRLGNQLARTHSAFATSETAPRTFDTGAIFHALRIEPYLLATAKAHPDLAPILEELAAVTARTAMTVVHGDVSPKNIMVGPKGPVFLDAECAWFGDPAFDLAFCLNHLLLKTLWIPSARRELLSAFDVLSRAYLNGVDWEPAADVERRAARLLPGLLLARIDGKSPVEYLDESSREIVRRMARGLLMNLPDRLGDLRREWTTTTSSSHAGLRPGASIARVIGRRVWDSRGRPTVEAEIALDNGIRRRAIAPSGASTGSREAVDLRDGGEAFGGYGVERAIANINTEIDAALRGWLVADQPGIDQQLIELDGTVNKARLGGNATVAVSMAVLHAAAAAADQPIWRHVAGGAVPILPMPMIQIFGGGAHANGRIDIQDFLVIPVGAATFDEALAMSANIYQTAGAVMRSRGRRHGVADEGGWWPEFASNAEALETLTEAIERSGLNPGTDVGIAIDVAASQLRRGAHYYLEAEGAELDSDALIARLIEWCRRYPIISIEDPLAEDDDEGMRAFTADMGGRIQIVGDDYLVTSADRIASAAASGACNAVLLKPNQVGTVTEAAAALAAARAAGWSCIASARSGESEDVTIAHLAVGWGTGQLKVGSIARSERTAKWNEVRRIEESMGPSAVFGRGVPLRDSLWRKGGG